MTPHTALAPGSRDIAIIGMGCMYPGAPNLEEFWRNIIGKIDAVTDPPPEAWDADRFYDPDSGSPDRVYCKKGGYLGSLASFDPLEHGVPPVGLGGEPDQWLALKVARAALADAGYPEGPADGSHTAVIIGKGTYINRGNFSWIQHSVVVDQTVEILKQIQPDLGAEQEQQIRGELQSNLPALNPETVPGLVPNIIAGRIANKLNLMGPSYTVDAACASALVAADHSIQELLSGRCDLAIMGGAQVTTPLPILNVFCQLNALSRREQIRPFDKDADGTILGEGIGMLVLKRLDDAVRDEDRIYAVIKGVGLSSDGRGTSVMAPRLEGEVAALERAYEASGVSPHTIGLIEAHGTGTAVGDAVEMQALDQVYRASGARPRGVAMGTVKSMIGHTLPASGAAGMIKAALSVYHKVLPPTLNVEEPNPKLGIEDTAFYLNTETRPWVHGSAEWPRRAGINAFGFGGANAHVVLEEYVPARDRRPRPSFAPWDTEVCVLQAEDRQGLVSEAKKVRSFAQSNPDAALADVAKTLNTGLRDGTERLAVVAASMGDLAQKLERAVERLSDPEKEQVKDRRGIYYFSGQPGRKGRVAFLFPGEGAQYPGMLADLYLHFPAVREKFDRMDRVFQDHPRGSLPSEAFFPRPTFSDAERAEVGARLWQIEGAVESVLTADMAMFSLLRRIGLEPGVLLGHSSGEYAAIAASSVIDLEDEERFRQFALDLNALYQEEEQKGGVPEARMLAVGADSAQVSDIVSQAGGQLYVAMDNCPHQTVIVGEEEAAQRAEELLRREGLIYQQLPFERAYHTPLFEPYLGGLREFFASYPVNAPSVETWSAASADRYPGDADSIRKLMVDHWAQPVQFRKTIEALYEEGVRTFVEVGPRNNLTTFVEDILRGRPHIAVASNVERGSGITQINHLVGLLVAQGVSMDLEYMYDREGVETVDFDRASSTQTAGWASREVKIPTGFPLLSISPATAARLRTSAAASHTSPSSPADAERRNGEGSASATASPEQDIEHGADRGPVDDRMEGTAVSEGNGKRAEGGYTKEESQFAMQHQQSQTPPGDQDGYSQAMLAYLETMNQFLRTQESVMHAFLGSAPPDGTQFTPGHVAGLLGQEPANGGNGTPAGGANGAASQQPVQHAHPAPVSAPTDAGVGGGHSSPAGSGNGAATAAQPHSAAEKQAVPDTNRDAELSRGEIEDRLLRLVSDRTGYPVEMLALDMDIEAELGIDSIKRVEVLGAFRSQYGILDSSDMDDIGRLKTLREVLDFLVPTGGLSEAEVDKVDAAQSAGNAALDLGNDPSPDSEFPMLGTLENLSPGKSLKSRRRLSRNEDLYLNDHTLGSVVSRKNPWLKPLAVMPLTMSMEIMAQAGAALMPGRLLTGIREVRAFKWIALASESLELEVLAERSGEETVTVRILERDGDSESQEFPVAEGVMVFGSEYPEPPVVEEEFLLSEERPSRWSTEDLYSRVMFHGPRWQGVASAERWGEDGLQARLRRISFTDFLASNSDPYFVTDPVVLDAVGQMVGFWTMDHLESHRMVFPYRMRELKVYSDPPESGMLDGRARIRLLENLRTSSDIDVLDSQGRLWMRVLGWEDKRFEMPEPMLQAMLSPERCTASGEWHGVVPPQQEGAPRVRLFALRGAFQTDVEFWTRVWASLVLDEAEREQFAQFTGPPSSRAQWLAGKIVAKDAVRSVLRESTGANILPADVGISHDEYGWPFVSGLPTEATEPISLSLTHTDGLALAALATGEETLGLGIDADRVRPLADGFDAIGFDEAERGMLDQLDATDRDRWRIRMWCAKEALGKSLGRGLRGGPRDVCVSGLDHETGMVTVRVAGELARAFPDIVNEDKHVYTTERDGYAMAVALQAKEPWL